MLRLRKRRTSSVVLFGGRRFVGEVMACIGDGWYSSVEVM